MPVQFLSLVISTIPKAGCHAVKYCLLGNIFHRFTLKIQYRA